MSMHGVISGHGPRPLGDSSNSRGSTCVRLIGVGGYDERKNDMIMCGNPREKPDANVIFFGGDVQDYRERMEANQDYRQYAEWDLESTAGIVHARMPRSHVWLVKPSQMYLHTFSRFSNFVETDSVGNPTCSPCHGAWRHIMGLLQNGCQLVNSQILQDTPGGKTTNHGTDGGKHNMQPKTCDTSACPEPKDDTRGKCISDLPVILIGFSKGCTVLNQLLHELERMKEDKTVSPFIGKVSDMYWLDGGHNGGKDTWITDTDILRHLVGTGINIHTHVTPYQIADPMRAWVGQEHQLFVSTLVELRIKVKRTTHFKEQPRSLQNHFNVLKAF